MQYFALQLETMSPLSIRADHSPSGVENATYISGTTVLGSLAALHRLSHPGDSAMFEQLFLSSQVQYPDLYPASFQNDNFNAVQDLPVYPLPKTAQSCKRFPGFKPLEDEEVDDERHGVRDTLLDWAAFALGSKVASINPQALLKPLQDHKDCPICKKEKKAKRPMDHFPGYYRRIQNNDGVEQLALASAETRL